MAVPIQQLSLINAAIGRPVKCKPALLLSVLMGTVELTACQTTPITASSNDIVATTTVIQAPVNPGAGDASDYPIEPDTWPEQAATAPAYPTHSAPRPVTPMSDNGTTVQNPLTKRPSLQTTTPQQLPNVFSNNSSNSSTTSQPPGVITNESITAPSRDDYMIQPPASPSHNELLERARQNSQQQSRQTASDGSNLPAFRNLMQTGTNQLKAGKLTEAESTFTRAQRLAPRSSAVYFYLSQVALKKNQPRKAEAMARRGLSVSQDASRRNALWQLILQSGQLQNNPRVIREAQQALR